MLVEFFDIRRFSGATVVGAENDQRVLALAVFLKGREDLSDRIVVLHHEIGIGIDAAFSLPFPGRNDGCVGRSVGQVEEKRRVLVAGALVEVGHRFFREAGQHIDRVVMLDHRVVFDHALHVSGMVKPVVVVESSAGRAVGDFGANGSEALRNPAFIKFRSSYWIGVEEVQMPLAQDGRVVALGFHETGHRGPVRRDQAGGESLDDSALKGRAPRVAPGHDTIAGRRAHRRGGVGVGKDHPGFRQGIQMRRGDFAALGIEALYIAVAKVVAEENDDVRWLAPPTLSRWSSRKGTGAQRKDSG